LEWKSIDEVLFSSRASRRADRLANAQIGHAGPSASVVDPQEVATSSTVQPQAKSSEKVVHEHFLRLSLNVPLHDQRMKYYKTKKEMLNNYKELEWNISKKDKYSDLINKQMEAQELCNDLLDKAQEDLSKEMKYRIKIKTELLNKITMSILQASLIQTNFWKI
jgi:hypothetical protein